MTTVLDFAQSYTPAGLSVLPVASDGTKGPRLDALPLDERGKPTWKPYQEHIATADELPRLFGRNGKPTGIGIIGGKVSGNLEILDIDDDADVEPYLAEVEAAAPGLLAKLPQVKTPRPGLHVYYRHVGAPEGNLKLAEAIIDGKKKTLIETRGEGGYVLAPGCPGDCHPTGRTYEHVAGPPITEVPTITAEERAVLLAVARSFNRLVDEPAHKTRKSNAPGVPPGDDYASKTTWGEILEPHGWVMVSARGDVTTWRRPGKSIGISATTGLKSKSGADLLCVFSSNAHPFDVPSGKTCGTFTKFAAYALLEHSGDFKAAAKALAAQGFGERRTAPASGENEADEPNLWKPEGRTESANARRLVAEHGRNIRWCDLWGKWLVWDGTRWALDNQCAADALAKQTTRGLWRGVADAAERVDEKLHAELTRFAKASNQANGIRNMLTLARSEPGVPILPAALDSDPMLLNVANGTLELRTGKIRPHDRADLLTKLAPVVYDADADCPTWRKFVAEVLASNAELIDYVRKLVGFCLTGSTAEHVLPFLYGTGANGKSVFLGTVLALMGEDYSMKAPPDLLTAKNGQAHPTERADLFGKRFVAAIEAEDGRRLAEALVKELSGGDKVRARRMREDFWEFNATHKIWLAANHKPTIRGTDRGIWRRVKLIPFTVTIPPERQDKQLPDKLKGELSGILNWALWGLAEYQAEGLGEPEAVKVATAEYRDEMDVLGEFLDSCCILDKNATVGATALFEAFVEWCERAGERPVKQKEFGVRLSERGFEIDRGAGGRKIRRGLGLLGKTG